MKVGKSFHIYTGASKYQMEDAIIQEGKLVAFFSQKLSPVQMNYSTTEKELLTIFLCLKEYFNILYGGKITVNTNHQNLNSKTLSVQHILCWRIFLDKFNLMLKYIEGKDNVLAYCFFTTTYIMVSHW